MDMTEPIDLLPGQMRFGRVKIFVFRVCGVIESQTHGMNGGHLDFIIPCNLFTVHINIAAHLTQPFDILLFGSHFFLLWLGFKASWGYFLSWNIDKTVVP